MRLRVSHCLSLAALALIAGCGGGGGERPPALSQADVNGPQADYPVVVGDPFTIDGVTHTPADKLNYDAVGRAVAGSDGGGGITAAHKTLPLPSYAEVTALDTGKTILVRVERRGPMANDRLVELSPGAAAQLGIADAAGAPVRLRRVNPPESDRALLRSGQRAPDRMDTPKALLGVLMRKLDPKTMAVATPLPPAHVVVASPTLPDPAPVIAGLPEPTPAVRAIPAGSLLVQAAAFSTRERAERAAGQIGGHVSSAGQLWRVRIGPFARQAEAEAALAKARDAGYSDARILRGK